MAQRYKIKAILYFFIIICLFAWLLIDSSNSFTSSNSYELFRLITSFLPTSPFFSRQKQSKFAKKLFSLYLSYAIHSIINILWPKTKKKSRQANEKERTHFCPYGFFHSKPDEVLSLKYIFEQLHLTTHPLKMLCKDILSDMLLDDYITEVEKSKYKLNNHGVEMTGTFQRKSNGKNSFIPEGGGDPIFVAERNSAHAMNNDKVRISFYAKRRGCEAEGEVIEVLERANDTFVGTLEVGSSYAFLVTETVRLPMTSSSPKKS